MIHKIKGAKMTREEVDQAYEQLEQKVRRVARERRKSQKITGDEVVSRLEMVEQGLRDLFLEPTVHGWIFEGAAVELTEATSLYPIRVTVTLSHLEENDAIDAGHRLIGDSDDLQDFFRKVDGVGHDVEVRLRTVYF